MEQFIEDRIMSKFHQQVPKVTPLTVPDDMPVLGTEVAPRYKAIYDPTYENYVWYDDDPHLYFSWFLTGHRIPMISVTTVLKAWEKPFDDAMAYRCARKDSYTCNCLDKEGWEYMGLEEKALMIERAWKQNSREAADYGTFAHAVMEGIALWRNGTYEGHHVDNIYDIMCDRYSKFEHEIVRTMGRNFITDILDPLLESGVQIIAEPLVYDMEALIAGQSDLVALDHRNKVISILDFKTNKRKPGTDKVYNKMEGQLSHLDDVAITHYCIQLCLYQRLVQNILPDYSLGENTLLWLDRDTGNVIPIPINPSDWTPVIDYMLGELKLLKNKTYAIYKVA